MQKLAFFRAWNEVCAALGDGAVGAGVFIGFGVEIDAGVENFGEDGVE